MNPNGTASSAEARVAPMNPARDLGLIAVFAAMIAAAAVTPGVPIGPVPITVQTLAVILTGLVLGPVRGASATLLYVLVGLVGPPVFTGGVGGLGIIARPSFGYVVSFPLAALLAGVLALAVVRRLPRRLPLGLSLAGIIATLAVIHPLGIVGLMINAHIRLAGALAVDVVFLPGDIVKAILAGLIAAAVHRAFPSLLPERTANR